MTFAGEIFTQTVRNIWAHKLRSTLTMFGISWGIASIVFMIAIGEGFKSGYKKMMYALGKDIIILWPGRTAQQAGGQRVGKVIHFTNADVQAIRHECYLVGDATPELARSLQVRSRYNAGLFSTHGVAPVYQRIRSMDLAAGRHISDADDDEARTVCVIGDEVRRQL